MEKLGGNKLELIDRADALAIAAHSKDFVDGIKNLPAIEYEPSEDASIVDGVCTKCGWYGDICDTRYYNYCPNCGRKVR